MPTAGSSHRELHAHSTAARDEVSSYFGRLWVSADFQVYGVSLTSTKDLICAEVIKFDEWIYFWNISRPLRPLQCCGGGKAVPCGHLAVKGW